MSGEQIVELKELKGGCCKISQASGESGKDDGQSMAKTRYPMVIPETKL